MDIKKRVVHLGKALLASAVISALLLLLMAFIMYKGSISGMVMHVLLVILYLFSCFVGGFLMGRQEDKRRFLWGAGFGGVYFLILLLISIASGPSAPADLAERGRVLLICVLGGMAGGMLS